MTEGGTVWFKKQKYKTHKTLKNVSTIASELLNLLILLSIYDVDSAVKRSLASIAASPSKYTL